MTFKWSHSGNPGMIEKPLVRAAASFDGTTDWSVSRAKI